MSDRYQEKKTVSCTCAIISHDSSLQLSSTFQVMHELGHNFNSHHTHDSSYSPVIDTCGTSCPAELPLAKSSTIMSFCQFCDGSYSNIDYTFGGKYNSGPRDNVTSYTRSHLQGSISDDPQRVNVVMWNHVASGLCTKLPTNACTGVGGVCTTAASCCSNKCYANGANAGTCAA